MSQRLHTFVFWLLLIALPLQSFAAVTGGACACMQMPTLEMTTTPAAQDHQMADHDENGATALAAQEESCHSAAPPETPHCDSDGAHAADKSSCGACAGCCVVHAAIPTALFAPVNSPAARVSAVSLPDLFTDHVAPTPKRPPRLLSA